MAEGEFAQVRHHLEEGLKRTAEWVGEHDLYAMLADVAVRQRDPTGLARYAPLAEQLATRYDHTLYQAIAHRSWGVAHRLAGEQEAAETRLKQALDLFQALETPWQRGRTLAELAEVALARNETAQAHHYFSGALALFEQIGAAPEAAQTRTALASLAQAHDHTEGAD